MYDQMFDTGLELMTSVVGGRHLEVTYRQYTIFLYFDLYLTLSTEHTTFIVLRYCMTYRIKPQEDKQRDSSKTTFYPFV